VVRVCGYVNVSYHGHIKYQLGIWYMEYVHNNMLSKTISTLGYEFCISINTNLGGKKHTRFWKMKIDWIHI
jgi:hypothetical protein